MYVTELFKRECALPEQSTLYDTPNEPNSALLFRKHWFSDKLSNFGMPQTKAVIWKV